MEIRFQKVTKIFSKKVSNFFMLPLAGFGVFRREIAGNAWPFQTSKIKM
jgi:hypothetical protein